MKLLIHLSAVIVGLIACAGVSADPRTVNDGVYTSEQASVGEELFANHCILCHDKKYFLPVWERLEGQPLAIPFTVMSTTMPQGDPGYLYESEYVDILAYILSLSCYAPGDTELDYQNGVLNEIMVAVCQPTMSAPATAGN